MGMPVLYKMCEVHSNINFYYFFVKIITSSNEHHIWLQESNRNIKYQFHLKLCPHFACLNVPSE